MSEKNNESVKILIVDDLAVNLRILENIIHAEGYEALCALSAEKALDIMKKVKPQLILSDYSMPGMNGLEFCRLIKKNPHTRDIPFVFITVANSSEEKKAAFTAGAVDYIPKPFERTEVVMRVNNQINSYKARMQIEDQNRMMHKVITEQKRMVEREQENLLLALSKVAARKNISLTERLERVGYNCRLLAQGLQLLPEYENLITDEFTETIGTASKVQDIGSILINENFAGEGKDGSSISQSSEYIKRHTDEGICLLEELSTDSNNRSRFIKMAVTVIKYNHAAWNGKGYPEGISGPDIPLEARITAVVNGFDTALTGEAGMDVSRAMDMVMEGSGTLYDPGIIRVFSKLIKQLKIT